MNVFQVSMGSTSMYDACTVKNSPIFKDHLRVRARPKTLNSGLERAEEVSARNLFIAITSLRQGNETWDCRTKTVAAKFVG